MSTTIAESPAARDDQADGQAMQETANDRIEDDREVVRYVADLFEEQDELLAQLRCLEKKAGRVASKLARTLASMKTAQSYLRGWRAPEWPEKGIDPSLAFLLKSSEQKRLFRGGYLAELLMRLDVEGDAFIEYFEFLRD